jgi:hypothetical protein
MLVMFREVAIACCVTTGFRHEVDRNCALLGYYAAGSGNFLPMFRDNLSVKNFGFLTTEDRTDRSFRNVDKKYYYYYSLRNDPEERSSRGEGVF